MRVISYSTVQFPFKVEIENLFGIDELSSLNENMPVLKRENDQSTRYHSLFYEWARTDKFKSLYSNFMLEVIYPLYEESIVYQSIPTFRIAYQNNIAVGEFHKDKHYRDISWAEQVKEDNFFLPFTDAFDTNTIWVESKEDAGDFSPMDCKYGEIIKWDGSNLMHGNKINRTNKTRVSVDFRVMSAKNYRPSDHGSINTNTKFEVGGYYSLMEVAR